MKKNQDTEARVLALRAIITTAAVLAALTALRLSGVICVEPDATLQMVEEMAMTIFN